MIASLLLDVERFLLPNVCIVCHRSASPRFPDALLCAVCCSRMRGLDVTGCGRCRHPLPPVGPCRFCCDWPDELRTVASAVWLDREARALVHGVKYHGMTVLSGVMAGAIVARVPPPDAGTTVIPVPTAAARIRRRGYDQTTLIARALAAAWKLPMRRDVLMRVTGTGSQTALTPERRLANVAGAYHAAGPGGEPQRPALLVDDVLTTGATLRMSAEALVRAGWRDVRGVTFARAEPYERAAVGH